MNTNEIEIISMLLIPPVNWDRGLGAMVGPSSNG
jgi:hypothetical protein